MNASPIPTPIMADQVGAAMRLLAGVIADAYGDEIADQDRTDIRLAVRAALDRVVAEGYAYARTVRQLSRQQERVAEYGRDCVVCPQLRRNQRCFSCGSSAATLARLQASRIAERERLRYGRAT